MTKDEKQLFRAIRMAKNVEQHTQAGDIPWWGTVLVSLLVGAFSIVPFMMIGLISTAAFTEWEDGTNMPVPEWCISMMVTGPIIVALGFFVWM